MLDGDYHDMFMLLQWCDVVLRRRRTITSANSTVSIKMWNDNEKRVLLQMAVDFMSAFKAVEKAHRIEHGLDVGKMERQATGATATYDALVMARHTFLTLAYPAPLSPVSVVHTSFRLKFCCLTLYEADADVRIYKNERRLRLRFHDGNFSAWVQVKIDFIGEVLTMTGDKDALVGADMKRRLPIGVTTWF